LVKGWSIKIWGTAFGSRQVQRTSDAKDGDAVDRQLLSVSAHAFRGKGALHLGPKKKPPNEFCG
jgi:hypothetical protein